MEIELEKTYLAKKIPDGLGRCESKELLDVYIPAESAHPKLRLRKKGRKYEMTKKSPIMEGDASRQIEQTIGLDEEEFKALSKLDGKKVRKFRYLFPYEGRTAEVDVFQDELEGLVLVDFEFASVEEKDAFLMPDFCLADVTQEDFIAGGMLCGKSYADLEKPLADYGYVKIMLSR